MANKKVTVEVDVETNLEPSIAQLKELKKQLKSAAAGSDDFKRLANEIDDLEDKIKGARKGSADWVDTLENAGGPLGMVGKGINSMKVAFTSFNTALKASIIGLVVAAIGGLVAAFSQSETAMKKLQPLFIGLERIMGLLFCEEFSKLKKNPSLFGHIHKHYKSFGYDYDNYLQDFNNKKACEPFVKVWTGR